MTAVRATALLLAAVLSLPGLAAAQTSMPGHVHGAGSPPPAAPAPSRSDGQDMMDATARMNHDMAAPDTMTGDPDRDFVAMMTPHHQGAIDMARIYLRTGRDPQLRRMAQQIITDQEREIRDMHAWQARHPTRPAP